MGLNKETATNFGTMIEYWHIDRITYQFGAKTTEIIMTGFITKDARMTGAYPLLSKAVTFSGDDFQPEATRTMLYEKIKLLPDFSDAQDV